MTWGSLRGDPLVFLQRARVLPFGAGFGTGIPRGMEAFETWPQLFSKFMINGRSYKYT